MLVAADRYRTGRLAADRIHQITAEGAGAHCARRNRIRAVRFQRRRKRARGGAGVKITARYNAGFPAFCRRAVIRFIGKSVHKVDLAGFAQRDRKILRQRRYVAAHGHIVREVRLPVIVAVRILVNRDRTGDP